MRQALRSKVALAVLAVAPLGAAFIAQPAAAQNYQYRVASAQGTVRNVTIDSDAGLRPGATLRLRVIATPGARWANVRLGDEVRVPLHERAPGEYVGTHVIRRSDRLDPTGQMTVRAGWGEGPVAVAFQYPASFQALAMGSGPHQLEVSSFRMWPHDRDRLDPGQVVHFRVEGTPNAHAWVEVPGVTPGVRLQEERPGFYVGTYTIRRQDDSDAFHHARAVLRNDGERVVSHLRGGRDDDYAYGR